MLLPLNIVEGVFQLLSPASGRQYLSEDTSDDTSVDTEGTCVARTALARCAQACRAFHEPAIRVLWREQKLLDSCGAVLLNLSVGTVKWPASGHSIYEGMESDDEENEDMDPSDYLYTYCYLPEPISDEEWARFEHYAPFVHVLHYSTEVTLDPSVFLFLQQYACGKPLFPCLRELIWDHATPELVSVISPSIRILRLREDVSGDENGHEVQEYGYRMRRHAFKQLLPTVLRDLPELEELELRSLGHEAFWHPLKSVPSGCFLSCNIHTLHISETHRALVRAALPILSTIEELTELNVTLVDGETLHDPQLINDWDTSSIRSLVKLRRLRLDGWATGVANLVNAIVAPELEDIELTCSPDPGDGMAEVDALSATFAVLRRRNMTSLRRLHVILCDLEAQRILSPFTAEGPFLVGPASPLLEFRHLEDVHMCQFDTERNVYMHLNVNVLALGTVWPRLRTLTLPGQTFSLEDLHFVTRACAELRSLSVHSLTQSFLGGLPLPDVVLATHSGAGKPAALQEFHVQSPFIFEDPNGASKIACILDSLLPQLDIERCSVQCTLISGNEGEAEPCDDILAEVRKLQLARHGANATKS